MPIFAAARVPEIWLCECGVVRVLTLHGDDYQKAAASSALAPLTAEQITDFLHLSIKLRPAAWARAVREWAQAQLPLR